VPPPVLLASFLWWRSTSMPELLARWLQGLVAGPLYPYPDVAIALPAG